MKYILDFDEVLFNTSALKEKMGALGIPESERGLDVFETIAEKDPTFDFKSLVFPGALAFVQEHGKDCIIVSSASSVTPENNTDAQKQEIFQMEKILRSGVAEYIAQERIHVVGIGKIDMLAELQRDLEAYPGEQIVFVDDRERYLREAKELGIPSIWMDRGQTGFARGPEGVPRMLEFPRVSSFKELREVIASCEKKEA